MRPDPLPDSLLVHKFTAYAYNMRALEYLAGATPHSLLVLCVRDPARVVVSWHRMHQTIARTGRNPAHFAWQEREFYADCSLTDYYRRFARERLRYHRYLRDVLEVVPTSRLAVVSQERMAEGIGRIGQYLHGLARGEAVEPPAPLSGNAKKHEGYADKAPVVLDADIEKELRGVERRLRTLIAAEVTHHCV